MKNCHLLLNLIYGKLYHKQKKIIINRGIEQKIEN